VQVQAGDYVVRADQPYRTLADMYFSLQTFSLNNPRPYDDIGWTFPLMRNLELKEIEDAEVLEQSMTPITSSVMAAGGVVGRGDVLVVDHTTDNALVTFRFRHASVPMLAAEQDFVLDDHTFRAGAFIIPAADRSVIEASLAELGLSAWATSDVPDVDTHELDVPRIGYVHSWRRTQDEGWVRGALDYYGVPYTYFADQKLRDGGLRGQYDVIIFPHVGGDAQAQVNGVAMTGELPLPYRRTEATPNLGGIDESDDIRGGMGLDGLMELATFVQEGGTLIVEGSTANILPGFGITSGVTVESPEGLIAPGSIHRGIIADQGSPITYGYSGDQIPVYFKNDLVLSAGGGSAAFGRGGGGTSPWQNTTPMANRPRLSEWQAGEASRRPSEGETDPSAAAREIARAFGGSTTSSARVVMQFPQRADQMLLSGTLGGGEALQGKAQVVDASVGDGHVVMFAIRPFWRWQTQGTYFLGFNTILNWNDLDAGIAEEGEATTPDRGGR